MRSFRIDGQTSTLARLTQLVETVSLLIDSQQSNEANRLTLAWRMCERILDKCSVADEENLYLVSRSGHFCAFVEGEVRLGFEL